jgi:dTMP kinase
MLIVFEGIDGSGKTTLSRMFASRLQELAVPVVWLCEPTDSPWGEKIRILARAGAPLSAEEELDYFLRDRRWDVEQRILPALRAGQTVVLDRYFHSTACYQGARGLDSGAILRQNREFAPEPDLVFVIDVEVETALARIQRDRTETVPLFEQKKFLRQVRKNYLSLAEPRVVIIAGAGTPAAVFARVWSAFRQRFPK